MRNLLCYPVTKNEVVEYLMRLYNTECENEAVGSMSPTLIQTAINIINASDGINIDDFGNVVNI